MELESIKLEFHCFFFFFLNHILNVNLNVTFFFLICQQNFSLLTTPLTQHSLRGIKGSNMRHRHFDGVD